MKVYSIGRETGCDIVINDSTDVISRRHAVLNVSPSGKMTITDQSHNGTYVNGIRISQNVPVPVTRKDNISFAHVARLDWELVPQPFSPMRYGILAAIAVVVLICCYFGYTALADSDSEGSRIPKTEEQIKQAVQDSINKETARKDSIEKAKNDSIEKAKRDSISKAKTPAKPKKDTGKKKEQDKSKQEKKPEPEKKKFR